MPNRAAGIHCRAWVKLDNVVGPVTDGQLRNLPPVLLVRVDVAACDAHRAHRVAEVELHIELVCPSLLYPCGGGRPKPTHMQTFDARCLAGPLPSCADRTARLSVAMDEYLDPRLAPSVLRRSARVHVGRRHVAQRLVNAPVIIVLHKASGRPQLPGDVA